jgi:glutathione S-transferase
MLRFYYAPFTCAMATHIVLETVGQPYEAVKLDFRANEQRSPEFLAVNPKGRVPAIVTDRGTLTETPALLLYLAQQHPQAGLAPLDDPHALAELQAVNNWFCSTVHVAHAHRPRAYRWADDEAAQKAMKAKVAQNMAECFDEIERGVLRGPWVMGEAYSIADPYLFTMTSWLPGDGVAVERFPRVADHFARMKQRPEVQRLLALYA